MCVSRKEFPAWILVPAITATSSQWWSVWRWLTFQKWLFRLPTKKWEERSHFWNHKPFLLITLFKHWSQGCLSYSWVIFHLAVAKFLMVEFQSYNEQDAIFNKKKFAFTIFLFLLLSALCNEELGQPLRTWTLLALKYFLSKNGSHFRAKVSYSFSTTNPFKEIKSTLSFQLETHVEISFPVKFDYYLW